VRGWGRCLEGVKGKVLDCLMGEGFFGDGRDGEEAMLMDETLPFLSLPIPPANRSFMACVCPSQVFMWVILAFSMGLTTEPQSPQQKTELGGKSVSKKG
jgi:hypothetical protein